MTGLVDLLWWLGQCMEENRRPCVGTPSSLKHRLDAVLRFFTTHRSQTQRPFPIVVVGSGGYDFLLSDWGIELFMPDRPTGSDEAKELLRFYAFRQTGRPSLGVPSYMASALSLVSIDAPTGPNQIESDPLGLAAILSSSQGCTNLDELLLHWGISSQQAALLRSRVAAWLQDLPPDPDPDHPSAFRLTQRRREYEVLSLEAILRLRLMQAPGGGPPQPVRIISLNFDEYVCMLRRHRCWEVEGAVYRGFAVELPRIVANAWMDTSGTYATKFADGGEEGLRDIFRERLETMLPRADQMVFQQMGPTLANNVAPPNRPRWNPSDVMITNHGFYFPPLGASPDFTLMLTEIAEGRAGNPVFTDSKRPDGDE